ncbi:hypothetical protein [Streptomyces cyaneofuscatus]|uniref:hypothetical protein n=1 Tax=Streptomyces cyaneofuscatus TaxID=66883 RepID=UPI00341A564A
MRPGGAPDGAGLLLADAIKQIPVAEEKRTGYERDSFKHWVDKTVTAAGPVRRS